MPGASYAFREDWTASGFFGFSSTGVQYADRGIKGLRKYAPFDQGPWLKIDTLGTSDYTMGYDGDTSRVFDQIEPTVLSVGNGVFALYRRLRIPRDFGGFSGITLFSLRNSLEVYEMIVTMWANGVADTGVNAIRVKPIMTDVWEQFTLTPTGAYLPGDFVTFVVQIASSSIAVQARFADWAPCYVTDKGNV